MSDEQVERVARAIQKAHFVHGHNWEEQARAAIAAMQPTPQKCAECDCDGGECTWIASPKVTPQEAAKWKGEWQWWAGRDEGWMTVGPCPTREHAIDEMVQDGGGEYLDETQDPPVWMNSFTVVEARQDPLRLADWIGADWILERADEALCDSDRVSCENDDGPWFEATKEQEADLIGRLRAACDEWQVSNGLKFHSTTFSHSRNHETVKTPALRAIAEEARHD